MDADAFRARDKAALGQTLGVPVAAPGAGLVSSVTVLRRESPMGTQADRDGVYELNGGRFRIRKGDPLPDGAKLVDAPKASPAKGKATTKGKGPSETTEGQGPSERG